MHSSLFRRHGCLLTHSYSGHIFGIIALGRLAQEVNDHVGFQPGVPVKPMLAKATTGISEVRALPMCFLHNLTFSTLNNLYIRPSFYELDIADRLQCRLLKTVAVFAVNK